MHKRNAMFEKEKIKTLLPIVLSFLVIIIYIVQASYYIHHIQPVMDESTYLLKGKWFIDGTYQPFQDYGPLTNKPPLSFIALGISQFLFGPGLESGRILAIIFSVIMLIGLWLIVNRLGGKWWALFSITLFILSPAWIIYYSRAMTQVISSLLVVWSLFFILGENKKTWASYVGVILAALTTMIRQNMLPFFGLVLIYLIWENGFKKGLRFVLAGIIVFILSNAIYWPKIYPAIWAPQLPTFINSTIHFLTGISSLHGTLGFPLLNKDFSIVDEIQVFFYGVRYFFIPFISTIAAFIIISTKSLFLEKKYSVVTFLAVSFAALTGIHFIASIGQNNFLYSYPAYFAFYLPVGIILVPLLFKSFPRKNLYFSTIAFAVVVLIIAGGMGLSLRQDISQTLMRLHVPSLKSFFHGEYELWDVLSSRFNIPYSTQAYLLPVAAGLVFGLFLLVFSLIVWIILKKNHKPIHYLSIIMFVLIFVGLILSPTFILAGKGSIGICQNDVLLRNENIGERLQSKIKPGALVYWEGTIPTSLLYLTNNKYFPVQLNMQFNYIIGGDADILERNGYWNDELAQRWIKDADYLVLSPETVQKRAIETDPQYKNLFSLYDVTESVNPCNNSAYLLVYKKTDVPQ